MKVLLTLSAFIDSDEELSDKIDVGYKLKILRHCRILTASTSVLYGKALLDHFATSAKEPPDLIGGGLFWRHE